MQYTWRHAPAIAATLFMALGLAVSPVVAQDATRPDKEYAPQVGQEGKDVIWVPTPQSLVERMLDMAKLTAKDIHYDLGSGDGRTVIAAAKRGAQAVGVEYNPDMVALSERAAAKEGVAGKAKFIHGDIFQIDFSEATVLTLYLLPSLNVKLRPTILNMKPGTRVVSHAFTMDDWQPDQTDSVDGRTAYLWIVPAKVDGTWQSPAGELTFKQQYQTLSGTLKTANGAAAISGAKLNGAQVSFSANGVRYTGRVNGDRIDGTAQASAGGTTKWSATRAPAAAAAQKPGAAY
jgi:SAM-dependent methyltransferase